MRKLWAVKLRPIDHGPRPLDGAIVTGWYVTGRVFTLKRKRRVVFTGDT